MTAKPDRDPRAWPEGTKRELRRLFRRALKRAGADPRVARDLERMMEEKLEREGK